MVIYFSDITTGNGRRMRNFLEIVAANWRSVLVLGFTWAWTSRSFFGMAAFPASPESFCADLFQTTSLTASVATLAVMLVFWRKVAALDSVRFMASACAIAVFCSIAASASVAFGTLLVFFAGAIGGCASVLMLFEALGTLGPAPSQCKILVVLSCALLANTAYYLLATECHGAVGFSMTLAAPCVALFLFRLQPAKASGVASSPQAQGEWNACAASVDPAGHHVFEVLKQSRFPWATVASFALFGIAYAIVRSLTSLGEDPHSAFMLNAIYRGTGAVVVAVCAVCSKEKYWSVGVCGILFWAVAFLSTYASSELRLVFTSLFATMGYTCFEVLMFAVLVEIATNTKVPFQVSFCVCSFAMLAASLAGRIFASCLSSLAVGSLVIKDAVNYDAGGFFVEALQCCIFFVLVVALVLFDSRRVSMLWGINVNSLEQTPSESERLEHILSNDYGLSPREREVASMMMRGRNEPYIAETLFVSKSTVHTYVQGIYAKTGVHSRQELLDVLYGKLDGASSHCDKVS